MEGNMEVEATDATIIAIEPTSVTVPENGVAIPNDVDMDETEKVFQPQQPPQTLPPLPWRKSTMDLKSHLFHVLNEGIMSDMAFVVGEERDCIPAHRFVLTLWSRVFEEMPDQVEIPEMNVAAIKSFLKYLYTEEFEVTGEDLMAVLCAAKRFEIPALAGKCVSVLKGEIKGSTAVGMFQAAKLLAEDKLAEESLHYILRNGGQVIQEDDFLRLNHDNLCFFLERDDFDVDEVELFQAVSRWATNECKKQELEQTPENHRLVLNSAVKLIRFPLMNSKKFALHVADSGILTDREMIRLLILNSIPSNERSDLSGFNHGFIDRERKSSVQPSKKRARTESRGSALLDASSAKAPKLITLDGEERMEDPQDWRNPKEGFKFNLMKMYENHYSSDVTFVVGDNKEKVFGHKFIVALWSSVFERMFQEAKEDAEGGHDEKEPIQIPNASPAAFRSFLKILYSENFDVAVEHMMNVFHISKEYDVAFLAEKCVTLLKGNVGDNTAVSIFQAAKGMNDDKLAENAWSYILRRGFAIIKERDFLNLEYQNLCTLLEQDELNVGETELFQSILRWASHQCDKDGIPKIPENLRMALKKAIPLIRFPLMAQKDFSLHVAPTELLTDREMVGVFVYHSLPPSERGNAYNLTFSSNERKAKTLVVKERVSLCNMSLKADRAISIHGFSFSGLDSKKLGYAPSSLYLYNSKNGLNHSTSCTETVVSIEGKRRFSIKFKLPITVRPNEWYISSEMTVGRQGEPPVENETWASVRNRQTDVNFQFQVQPIKGAANGIFDYAVPEVIFTLL